jgi:hypothetical protein
MSIEIDSHMLSVGYAPLNPVRAFAMRGSHRYSAIFEVCPPREVAGSQAQTLLFPAGRRT